MSSVPPSTHPASRAVTLLVALVAGSLLAGALAAGLVLPAVGATGLLTRTGVDYFNSLPSTLQTSTLPVRSTMYYSDGKTVLASFFVQNRVLVPLSQIAPVMQKAIVAIEDSRFYSEGGIDPRAVVRAAISDALGAQIQGASTLTEQYVKNMNLQRAYQVGDVAAEQAATARSLARKLSEMRQAIALDHTMSKNQILDSYLNITLFGENTYGIEAAAQYYFDEHAAKLTLDQAAMLAGMVQAPAVYDPFSPDPQAIKATTQRRNEVLTRMYELGDISKAQYTTAIAAPVRTHRNVPRNGCLDAGNAAYFCQYVVNEIQQDQAFAALGKTPEQRLAAVTGGGLKIVTTLDPQIQDEASAAVDAKIPVTDRSNLAAAAVTVQPGTGQVLAMTQNRIYALDNKRGDTALNYSVDKAYGGSTGFQTGSTFKAFTLAAWLEAGHSLSDTVDASAGSEPFSAFTSCGSPLHDATTGPYTYGNSEPGVNGPMSVLDATADSVNKAFVAMETKLDLCDIAQTADRFGVHLAEVPRTPICADTGTSQKVPDCLPALTLGPLNISPLTMAAAYAGFADQGTYCSPVSVLAVHTRTNQNLPVPTTQCSEAVSPQIAATVTTALQQVLIRGTAAGQALSGRDSAGKTGTTDASKNTWFVGYTPQLTTAVWVADPTSYPRYGGQRPLRNLHVSGHSYAGEIFGATLAAPIWHDIMTAASSGLPAESFASGG